MSDGVLKILSKLGSKINKVFEAFLVQKYIVWRCDWELRGNEKVSSRTKPFNQIDYGDRSMAVTPPQRAAGERERGDFQIQYVPLTACDCANWTTSGAAVRL